MALSALIKLDSRKDEHITLLSLVKVESSAAGIV